MNFDLMPIHSETLVLIGAGATASLGMPPTDDQTKIFRSLSDDKKTVEAKNVLKKYFSEKDLLKLDAFLSFLDGKADNYFLISDSDLENARIVFGETIATGVLQNRILELRSEYDWNALKKIIKVCPHNERSDNLIRDVYSIIDRRILSHQSLKVNCQDKSDNDNYSLHEEILSQSRLHSARNFLTLFVNMLFAGAWYKISQDEKSDVFEKYKKFINSFDLLMQKEGKQFFQQ